jgi:HK97 family phage major capsid protein
MDIRKLRSRLTDILADMERLNASVVDASGAIRNFSKEEETRFSELETEKKSVQETIKRAEEIEAGKAELRDLSAPTDSPKLSVSVTRAENHNERGEYIGFKTLGEQLRAIWAAGPTGVNADKRLGEVRAASGLNTMNDQDGGFLLQPSFVIELMKESFERGVLASKARKFNIGAGFNSLRIVSLDESTRVDGSRFGGVQTYWRAEAGTVTKKQPAFKELEINTHSLMSLCFATEEVLQDAVALESLIGDVFVEDNAWKLDDSILTGDGSGKPLGILESPALIEVAKETSPSTQGKTVVRENVSKMRNSHMTPSGLSRAEWFVSQETLTHLEAMYVALGTATGIPIYAPAGQFGVEKETLYRRPINVLEQASKLGDVGDFGFYDMSQYGLVLKSGIDAQQSIHVRFEYNERAFRFVSRVGGMPLWDSAITPAKATSGRKVSPFVSLGAR